MAKIEYRTEKRENIFGDFKGWINRKYVDGVAQFDTQANPWMSEELAESWTCYLNAGAKMAETCEAATEDEKALVVRMWLMDQDSLIETGKHLAKVNSPILYAARYIYYDRFSRISGKMTADAFWAKFGAAQAAPTNN